MQSNHNPQCDPNNNHCTDVAEFLRILHEPGDVFEVRVINCPERVGGTFTTTAAGWFMDPNKAALAIESIEKLKPPAVYVSVNPCKSVLMGRAMSRIAHKIKSTTVDADILRRRWLFIDIDAKRPSGISSTEAELHEADVVSDAILTALRAEGWPEPLVGMSGNGRYLLWRIDLPNDEQAKELVTRVLYGLAERFDTDGAEIDCSTFNAARITKVLGTVARKGDEVVGVDGIDNRPHRRSWFIRPTGELCVVPVELLESVATVEAESVTAKPALPVATTGRPDVIERASMYLAKMAPSIEGQKGSDRAYAAACAMVLGFELSSDDAFRLLANEFNPRCEPAWSEKELRHKIDSASKATGERGALLRGKPKAGFDDAWHVEFMSDPAEAKTAPSESSKSIDEPWPDPEPLPDPLCSVLPYDSDLLPESIGSAVGDIAERMQCPPDFPAAAMLVALAALVGCRVGIRPRRHDDWLVVPNLWGCVVGRPSLKKSPAIQTAEKRIRAIEARERERLAEDIGSYEIEALLAQSKIKANKSAIDSAMKKGDSDKARQLAEETVELADEAAPVPRRIITTDSTIEKLGELLNVHRAGMLLWVDELVGWMRSLDREDKGGVRQQFLTLWNGQGRLNIDRVMRGETVVESPCVSVFGCATPGGLSDYVAAALRGGRGDDGLMQRLQIVVWPDSPKEYRHVDRWPDTTARRDLATVFESLADLDVESIAQRDDYDEDGIPWLRFDRDGQEVFDNWDSALQRRLRSDELPESFESHLSKYASMVPSIALVIHLASDGGGAVSGDAARCAVRWAEYLESHASRVYSIATAPERQSALPLLRRLIEWPVGRPILARAIGKKGWAGLSDKESVERTLELLADLGWVRSVEVRPATGRPTVEYRLHPEAKNFLQTHLERTPKTPKTLVVDTFGGFGGTVPEGLENKSAPSANRVQGVL